MHTPTTFFDQNFKEHTIEIPTFVNLWNEYCEKRNNGDRKIWLWGESAFYDQFSSFEIAQKAANGYYSPNDLFVTLDKNGNFFSSNDPVILVPHRKNDAFYKILLDHSESADAQHTARLSR